MCFVFISNPNNGTPANCQGFIPSDSVCVIRDFTLRRTFPHGGQPQPCPRPLMNQSRENMATVEDWEKAMLIPPTRSRPMENSQRALMRSDSTPLMNLLMA